MAAGDRVEVISRPEHSVTIGLVARLNHADRALALRLLEAAGAGSTQVELDELLGHADLRPAPRLG